MKKWIWISGFVLVLLIGAAVVIYMKAIEPFNEAEEMAIQIAKKETSIETFQDFSVYNGTKTYYILHGHDSDGKKMIVWIPEEEENCNIVTREAAKGISKEEAIQILSEEKQPEKINSVKLGMENNIPLWEIYYSSKEDSMSYYYIDFITGEMLKDIENL